MGDCFLLDVCFTFQDCFGFRLDQSRCFVFFSVQFNKLKWTLTTLHIGPTSLTPRQKKRTKTLTFVIVMSFSCVTFRFNIIALVYLVNIFLHFFLELHCWLRACK